MRFRPILMTTMAALFGGVPMMLGSGVGSELRQPFGYIIAGAGYYKSQWEFLNHNLVVRDDHATISQLSAICIVRGATSHVFKTGCAGGVRRGRRNDCSRGASRLLW
jgi:hypothetical protein